MSAGPLPADLHDWIEATTGGSVVAAHRHLAGASRQAWSVDVTLDDAPLALFVLRDNLSGTGGSSRDAAVLRALSPTAVPVPKVHANDPDLRSVLLERVDGRSDFPEVDREDEREPTARDLMVVTAALHALDPRTLAIEHLGAPGDPSDHARQQLDKVDAVAAMLGDTIAPLFTFALGWLRRSLPQGVERSSLVHSDMGPGNFLARAGRVTAVLDWEVAHWGDAMEDLAAIAVRDMATPVGHLPARFADYAAASGTVVDLGRVAWYRVLVLTRNAMLIGLGLSRDDPAVDRAQLTMFRILLMRAGALSLCDAIGVPRPVEAPLAECPTTDDIRLATHARRDQHDVVAPAIADSFAAQRAYGGEMVLGYLEHKLRFGADYHAREMDDLAGVIGHQPLDELAGWRTLRDRCGDASLERAHAAFFGRHLLRRGMIAAPLLGPLAERLPQRLEA